MIKTFCDLCSSEIIKENKIDEYLNPGCGNHTGKFINQNTEFQFQIITGINGTWNKGDFCKFCIVNAIVNALENS